MKARTLNHNRNQGFTIVELLIVVVIIAVLATVTIVAYNSIASNAKDSARQSDMNAFKKKVEMHFIETGSYNPGAVWPATREEFLEQYDLTGLSSKVTICNYDVADCTGENEWDTSRLYVLGNESPGRSGIASSYWSNRDEVWKNHIFFWGDENQENPTQEWTSTDAPFDYE